MNSGASVLQGDGKGPTLVRLYDAPLVRAVADGKAQIGRLCPWAAPAWPSPLGALRPIDADDIERALALQRAPQAAAKSGVVLLRL